MTPSACADEGEAPRRLLAVSLAMVAAIAVACAPAIRVALPDVSRGTTDPLGQGTVASLAAACAPMVTMTANVGVSGRVGRQRVRGSLQVGLSRPGRVRIDAVAPFGAPIFVLASDGRTTTLVLPREQAVVRGATVAELLDALIQVPLTADDLASVMLACPRASVDSDQSRLLPGGDVSAADAGGVTSFARVAPAPRLLGMLFPVSGQRARQIAIAFAPGGPGRRQIDVEVGAPAAAQLRMTLSDVESGAMLGDEAFVAVVPPGTRGMSLDELRRISPFAAPQGQ